MELLELYLVKFRKTYLKFDLSNQMMRMLLIYITIGIKCAFMQGKANVDTKNNQSMTALHLAAYEGYFEMVKILTQHGK